MVVDIGFSNNIQAEAKGIKLEASELVESIKLDNSYKLNYSDAKPKELYTCVALVERVIDADTFWLNIDCGFKVWTRKKVRLRGIDAPELSTKEGRKAKEFVEAKLKEVDFVVVKTYKDDKYGRYLADVFYLKGEADPQKVLEESTFLNQELLDRGLAREMRG
jgi:endonuclease YncB( thermonuclease family)